LRDSSHQSMWRRHFASSHGASLRRSRMIRYFWITPIADYVPGRAMPLILRAVFRPPTTVHVSGHSRNFQRAVPKFETRCHEETAPSVNTAIAKTPLFQGVRAYVFRRRLRGCCRADQTVGPAAASMCHTSHCVEMGTPERNVELCLICFAIRSAIA
jgi:hypothetical protein